MSDIVFVAAAYLLGLGALTAYAAGLLRRLRQARSMQAALQRRTAAEQTGALTNTQPQ